jgi:hypothetical protein
MKKFDPGQLLMTRGVNDMMANSEEFAGHVRLSIIRHMAGDWGDVSDEGRVENELALQEGDRLFSIYKKEGLPNGLLLNGIGQFTTLLPDQAFTVDVGSFGDGDYQLLCNDRSSWQYYIDV